MIENNYKSNEINYWKWIGIISLICLLGIGGYFGYNYIANNVYNAGYMEGILYTANTGNIPYLDVKDNVTISTISLRDYCAELIK